MTGIASRRLQLPGQMPIQAALGPRSDDIVELVMADHRRIRRMCRALDDAVRWAERLGPDWLPADAWRRLATLLEAHSRAEEEICYLPAVRSGAVARARIQDSVADHDDFRELIKEAALCPAGSRLWWHAVSVVLAATPAHLEQEEREVFAAWQDRMTMRERRELGRQWTMFIAASQSRLHVPDIPDVPRSGSTA